MSKDYIERDVAIELMEIASTLLGKYYGAKEAAIETWSSDIERDNTALKSEVIEFSKRISALKLTPAADVKPVIHGEWLDTTKQIGFPEWTCSVCGGRGRGDYFLCPWCGADMRGKQDDSF